MDINQKLLAAFQVEHIEHLEGIRACLARWDRAGEAPDVDEAFRRAHSLKGAARVTGFTPVETLAHSWKACSPASARASWPSISSCSALFMSRSTPLRIPPPASWLAALRRTSPRVLADEALLAGGAEKPTAPSHLPPNSRSTKLWDA